MCIKIDVKVNRHSYAETKQKRWSPVLLDKNEASVMHDVCVAVGGNIVTACDVVYISLLKNEIKKTNKN